MTDDLRLLRIYSAIHALQVEALCGREPSGSPQPKSRAKSRELDQIAMLFKTLSAAVYGIDASIIEVEVDVSGIRTTEDHFHTVGLPDAAVRESRERIRSALRNCGYDIPATQITVNLAPADIKKEGSGFDLPMALGILGAYGALNKKELGDYVLVGELSLDG